MLSTLFFPKVFKCESYERKFKPFKILKVAFQLTHLHFKNMQYFSLLTFEAEANFTKYEILCDNIDKMELESLYSNFKR